MSSRSSGQQTDIDHLTLSTDDSILLRIHYPLPSDTPKSPVLIVMIMQFMVSIRLYLQTQWWLLPELNRGHRDFQSPALPTELFDGHRD